jgi:xanthine/uracil permease
MSLPTTLICRIGGFTTFLFGAVAVSGVRVLAYAGKFVR